MYFTRVTLQNFTMSGNLIKCLAVMYCTAYTVMHLHKDVHDTFPGYVFK